MRVLYDMERAGVLIDMALLERQGQELGRRMLEIEQQAKAAAGQPFNLNSPRQIQEILFERLGIKATRKTPTGQPRVDEEVLQELALDHAARLILDYRPLSDSSPPTPTSSRAWSTRAPAACTPRSTRPR